MMRKRNDTRSDDMPIGEWCQCVEGGRCDDCDFDELYDCNNIACTSRERSDDKEVYFKKLEKVGEPYELYGHLIQKYRYFHSPAIQVNGNCILETINTDKIIEIEIKQNKEDMGDLDKIKVRDYTKVEELNVMEEKKLNLKPFDIQKAREGKPVCTRDGHKARIICFDYNGETGDYPIVALVHYNKGNKCYERVLKYTSDGLFNKYGDYQHDDDLMMLPEKKEGWVNVYNSLGVVTFSHNPYDTKEEALADAKPKDYVDTVKINWGE